MANETQQNVLREFDFNEFQYPKYDKKEAAEIIIPTEVNASYKKTQQARKQKLSLSFVFEAILDFAENTGEFTVSVFKNSVLKIFPVIFMPFGYAFRFIGKLWKALGKLRDKSIRQRLSAAGKIKDDIRNIRLLTLKQDDENKTRYFVKSLRKYILSSLPEEKIILKSAVSYLFPIAVIGVIALSLLSQNGKVFAMEVMYGGNTIGYVENQGIFNEGKNKALQALGSEDSENLLKDISFELKRVNVSELSNASMISEGILNGSDTAYKRACGIYVDGTLLCATPNESDALSVFGSILSPYENSADNNTIVDFVEEIDYVQGYYPEDSNIIWDSAKLLETLSDKETSPVRVKVMKTVTRTETVKYKTVKKNTSTLYKGTKKTTQKGKNGKVVITELVTYIDSKKTYTGILSEKETVAPVDEIVLIGTKSGSSSSSYAPTREFIWPTRGAYSISSYYGYRSASISGWSYHGGLDIVLGSGSSAGIPVVASASGRVITAYSGWSGYGHTVVIDHGNGIRTRYAHMYPGSLTVRVGDRVYQGQQIGRIGSTGNSTGPHLHFEVLVNGYKVNPLPYIR